MSFPKVIIIGETFRSNGGGGITMMNLFKDWPSDNLAVVTELTAESSPTFHCRKYYQIGNQEKKIIFPLSWFKKKILSGEVMIGNSGKDQPWAEKESFGLRSFLKLLYYKTIMILGINHLTYKMQLSEKLLHWVKDFSPDIVYHQPFNFSDMQLAYQLKCAINIPMVIHVMDDIVSFANRPNLLYYYWQKRIHELFRRLIDSASACLSISDYMSVEYYNRYNKNFIAFRNPVELDKWMPHMKKQWEFSAPIRIVYTGRLAVPNINSLLLFCRVISNVRKKGHDIVLDIYSLDENHSFYRRIKTLDGISIMKPIPYSQIPELISNYDIALLPIDFNNRGIRFARFSISTKTSEYLISGVPVILLAPGKIALTDYARRNDCMYIISNSDLKNIENRLMDLIINQPLREEIARKGIKVARIDSDACKVRREFKSQIKSAIH